MVEVVLKKLPILDITVVIPKDFRFRVWIGCKIMSFGARIMGVTAKEETI